MTTKPTDEWQPIETAPKDGTEILITDGYDVCTGRYRISNVTNYRPFYCVTANGEDYNVGFDWQVERVYLNVTHWMPLPEAPQETTEGV